MSTSADVLITISVDTDKIGTTDIKDAVSFSDSNNDPISIVGPGNFVSQVYKNQTVIWTAESLNGESTIYIQNIKKEEGSPILEHVRRGNGSQSTFTGKIKNDDNIKIGDEESYSMTISLAGFEGVTGSNDHGPIVFLGKKMAYMNVYKTNTWHIIGADAPWEIEGIAGENTLGVIVYAGSSVAHMNNYAEHKWTILPTAPYTKIEGITGDNISGPIIYSGNQVSYLQYAANKWVSLVDAPFKIDGISGDNRLGVIIYSGSKVAYMERYADRKWTMLADAPFEIEGIAGNNNNGPVVYSGSQIAYLLRTDYESNKWQSAGPAPFLIEGLAGNNASGFIICSGSEVKHISIGGTAWADLAPVPFDTKTFTIDPKLQIKRKI